MKEKYFSCMIQNRIVYLSVLRDIVIQNRPEEPGEDQLLREEQAMYIPHLSPFNALEDRRTDPNNFEL